MYIQTLDERKEKASRFLEACGFEVTHQHGQRISTNKLIDHNQMQHVEWSEIFIGKLPRDMFEDELVVHLFREGQQVYRIRYMMDFSGSNRGFCFVKYANTHQAIEAIRYLDGRVLRQDKPPIGAKLSFDNKCLFIGNIPMNCSSEELRRKLVKASVTGITDVRLAGVPRSSQARAGRRNLHHYHHGNGVNGTNNTHDDPGQFGYVYFESHDDATRARRILLPGEVKIAGRKLTLDWAKSEIPAHIMQLLKPPSPPFIVPGLWSGQAIASPNLQSLAVL